MSIKCLPSLSFWSSSNNVRKTAEEDKTTSGPQQEDEKQFNLNSQVIDAWTVTGSKPDKESGISVSGLAYSGKIFSSKLPPVCNTPSKIYGGNSLLAPAHLLCDERKGRHAHDICCEVELRVFALASI